MTVCMSLCPSVRFSELCPDILIRTFRPFVNKRKTVFTNHHQLSPTITSFHQQTSTFTNHHQLPPAITNFHQSSPAPRNNHQHVCLWTDPSRMFTNHQQFPPAITSFHPPSPIPTNYHQLQRTLTNSHQPDHYQLPPTITNFHWPSPAPTSYHQRLPTLTKSDFWSRVLLYSSPSISSTYLPR